MSRVTRLNRSVAAGTRRTWEWLSCHTQEEIAEAVGYSRVAITEFLGESGLVANSKIGESDKTDDSDEDDEDTNSLGRYKLSASGTRKVSA